MRRWALGISIASLMLAASGCAETYFRPASDDVNGIRYYLPAVYVLIKPNYVMGTAEIVTFLGPDTEHLYAAEPYSWMASNTTELTFQGSMLTKAVSKPDSTKVAVDTIGAMSAVASKAIEAAAANAAKAARSVGKSSAGVPIFLFKVDGNQLTPVDLTDLAK